MPEENSPSRPAETAPLLRRLSSAKSWLYAALIVSATLLIYFPALRGGFLWDDVDWTTGIEPLLRNGTGLWRMWVVPTALQQYYPLTGTSFWLDHHLWGAWTTPYHVENVLLHALSAILFWRLLKKLDVPGAWLAGAVFALHPVMAESVGWITERKNVLCMALFLGSLIAYAHFCEFWKSEPRERRPWGIYALSLALFFMALLAKITAFVLPATVLLLCWWKRGRIRLRADVLPTLPFFAATIALGLAIARLEALNTGPELTGLEPALITGEAPWFYIGKLLWPADLSFVYPQWDLDVHSLVQWLPLVSWIAGLLVLWFFRRRFGRGPVTAALFFIACLFPVLGLLDVTGMHLAFVADRWVYFSSLGFIALAVGVLHRFFRRFPRWAFRAAGALVLCPLAWLTWDHAALLKDGETLWTQTIRQHPDSWIPWNVLGAEKFHEAKFEEAFSAFHHAVELAPSEIEARVNLANALQKLNRYDDAIHEYEEALFLMPSFVAPQVAASAHYDLALALLHMSHPEEAQEHFEKALTFNEAFPAAQNDFGNLLLREGHLDDALAHYEKALEIQPDDSNDLINVANVFYRQGKSIKAETYFEEALKIDPQNVTALNNLAWALSASADKAARDGPKALELAQKLQAISHGVNAQHRVTLAMAYTETGQFPQAVAAIKEAQALAVSQGNTAFAEGLQEDLAHFEAGQPLRDEPAAPSSGK